MRKLFLALTSCMALVVFTSLSATAFASDVSDPDCDQYGNQFGIYGLYIETPPTDVEYEVSGVTGGVLACGSAIHDGPVNANPDIAFPGWKTLNKKAVITDAPGVLNSDAPSADLPVGTYIGKTRVDTLTWLTLFGNNIATIIGDQTAYIRVDEKANCEAEMAKLGDPAEPISTCYRTKIDTLVTFPLVGSWIWVIEDQEAGDSKAFTIGPTYNFIQPGVPAGITEIISMELCEYGGEVGVQGTAGACGTNDPNNPDFDAAKWVHKTGKASAPDCNSGMGPEGIYTAYVSNWNGETSDITDESTTCIVWEPLPVVVTEPECDQYGNQRGFRDVIIDTPDSREANVVSSWTVSLLACGQWVSNLGDSYTGSNRRSLIRSIDVGVPPGVKVIPTYGSDIENGDYVGRGSINVLTWAGDPNSPLWVENIEFVLRADVESEKCVNGAVVACYKGESVGGEVSMEFVIYVTEEADGRYTRSISNFSNRTFPGTPIGVSKINELTLCGYAGGKNGCGDSPYKVVQTNGFATVDKCRDGNGLHFLTALTGTTAQSWSPYRSKACMQWSDGAR